MKSIVLILLTFISMNSIAQKSFEKGYYITNSGDKIEGFIKNSDWKNNPTSFEFKRSLDANVEVVAIAFSKEFGIDSKAIYVKSVVEIERSSERNANLGYEKNPQFKTETLFLKLLVSGKNKLYQYYNDGIEKFFYSKEDNPIKQLVFIKYKISLDDTKNVPEYKNFEPNSVLLNENYKKQLFTDVRCSETLSTEPSMVNYTSNELSKYFIKINNCNGSIEKIAYEVKKTLIILKAVAAVNKTGISYERGTLKGSFDEHTGYGIGMELEFIFPFNNYEWGLFIEPTFSSVKAETTDQYGFNNTLTQKVNVSFNQIQCPLGIRYYFDINKNSRVYLGCGFNVTNVKNGTVVDFESSNSIQFADFSSNFLLSVGYKYKRFSAELRYYTAKNASLIQIDVLNVSQNGIALKYEIFKNK